MKHYFFFIFLGIYSALQATSLPLCYSVQLASSIKPFSKINSYPSECKVIQLKKNSTIRCNCLQEKKEAKKSLQKYKKHTLLL